MKLTHSIIAIAALSTLSYAGGDINPVTVFEQEPVYIPVEPVPLPLPEPEPVYEEIIQAPPPPPPPAPTPMPQPVVQEIPKPVVITPPPPPKAIVPAVVAPVVAEALGLYVAGGITSVALQTDGTANFFKKEASQDRQMAVTGRLGYDFMDYLGAELRGAYYVRGTDSSKFKQIGAYLKPNIDVAEGLNLYGLLGASKANLNTRALNSDFDTGFSYGLGLDYDITDSVSVFSDAVNYLNKTDSNNQWGLTLGAAYNF